MIKTPIIVTLIYNYNFSFLVYIVTTFKQQKFRVEPKNVNAREGSNVTLLCEIDDLTGDVQWTKDGLALGRLIACYANVIISDRMLTIFNSCSESSGRPTGDAQKFTAYRGRKMWTKKKNRQ